MPVHIGEMTTDVIAQPATSAPAREANELPAAWTEEERLRKVADRRECLHQRTSAHGYDD
jgi:hypothetical protein